MCESIFKENFLDQFIVLIMKLLHYKNKLIRNKMSKFFFQEMKFYIFIMRLTRRKRSALTTKVVVDATGGIKLTKSCGVRGSLT